MLAREFYSSHHVLQVDVRNHGLSAHSNVMNYEVMAADLIETLDELNIEHFSLIGHSMGKAGDESDRTRRRSTRSTGGIGYYAYCL